MPTYRILVAPLPPEIATHKVYGRISETDYNDTIHGTLVGIPDSSTIITSILWGKFAAALRSLNLPKHYDPANATAVVELLDRITFGPSPRPSESSDGPSGTPGLQKRTARKPPVRRKAGPRNVGRRVTPIHPAPVDAAGVSPDPQSGDQQGSSNPEGEKSQG